MECGRRGGRCAEWARVEWNVNGLSVSLPFIGSRSLLKLATIVCCSQHSSDIRIHQAESGNLKNMFAEREGERERERGREKNGTQR